LQKLIRPINRLVQALNGAGVVSTTQRQRLIGKRIG